MTVGLCDVDLKIRLCRFCARYFCRMTRQCDQLTTARKFVSACFFGFLFVF